MSEQINPTDWNWYGRKANTYGYDSYDIGPFHTREEVIKEAKAYGYIAVEVIEAKVKELKLSELCDTERIINAICETAYEDYGSDEGTNQPVELNVAEENELGDMLKATIDKWQTEGGYTFLSQRFDNDDIRNHETVILNN